MSNYYEVFQQRCYNRGLSFKEVVQKQAEHSFQRFLKSSRDKPPPSSAEKTMECIFRLVLYT